ncbi:MAG: copper amine oxidase N-terminal domain-containing protein [Armatimonas sp.]
MKNRRNTIALLAAIGAGITITSAAHADIRVRVNGNNVPFSNTPPQMQEGRVLVPLRGVLEQIGADINWNEATQTVTARMANRTIELPLGSRQATVNGETVSLAVPATRIAGSTMVPLRFLSEALGASVDWNESSQRVDITTDDNNNPNRPPRNESWRNGERRDRNNTDGDRNRGDNRIQLMVNGKDESFGAARPFLKSGEVMVPLQVMSTLAEFSYRYNPDNQTVVVGEKELRHEVGSSTARMSGEVHDLHATSEMRNGILYVPLDFVSLASDRPVRWNQQSRTVWIGR